MDFFLLALSLGAVLSIVSCIVQDSEKRQVSFRIAAYVALVTGFLIVLFVFGLSVFTAGFWTGGKVPGGVQLAFTFGLSAIASFATSSAVVLLYRVRQKG